MTRRWADVAELIATQGLKGRLVARSVRGLPFLLCEGMTVDFVPPTLDGPRAARVRCVQHLGSEEYAVEFDKVRNRDTAELLAGSHCLISHDDLPDDFDDIMHANAEYLEGFLVVDRMLGEIGRIVDVREMPTQELLIVEGDEGEIMIPLVDDFIVEFDDDERVLEMDLPSGLVQFDSSTDERAGDGA
ncbi:MAG: 16S rRNA processing protein RimM [Slackia sp.]|nr:16S rRNA processing protein RimM [Slackia sp.]